MKDFSERLQSWLEQVARSLRNSFENYWPADEGWKNDPDEKNVSFHFAHILLREGCSVFAEANHPDRNHPEIGVQGIDLLGFGSELDWFLACEFKRLLSNKGPSMLCGFLNDIERLERFWINTRLDSEDFGEHRCNTIAGCRRGFGLVAGLLWVPASGSSSVFEFWNSREVLGRSPYLPQMSKKLTERKAYWPKPVHAWSEASGSAYYLLAAAFELTQPVVAEDRPDT